MPGLGERLLERAGRGGQRAGGLGGRALLVMPGELPEPVLGPADRGGGEIARQQCRDRAHVEEGAEIAVARRRRRRERIECRDRGLPRVRLEDQLFPHRDQRARERVAEGDLGEAEANGAAFAGQPGAVQGAEPGGHLEPGPGMRGKIGERGAALVTRVPAGERDRDGEGRRTRPCGEVQHGAETGDAVGIVRVPGKARVGAALIGAGQPRETDGGRRGPDHREVPGAELCPAAGQAEPAALGEQGGGAVAGRAELVERDGAAGEGEARGAAAPGQADGETRAGRHGKRAAGNAQE